MTKEVMDTQERCQKKSWGGANFYICLEKATVLYQIRQF